MRHYYQTIKAMLFRSIDALINMYFILKRSTTS